MKADPTQESKREGLPPTATVSFIAVALLITIAYAVFAVAKGAENRRVVGDPEALARVVDSIVAKGNASECMELEHTVFESLVHLVGLESSSRLGARQECLSAVARAQNNMEVCKPIYTDPRFGYLEEGFVSSCRREAKQYVR